MEEQTCFILNNKDASQEIYCPYCKEEQKTGIMLVANIIKAGGEEPTTCICYACKKEFVISSIEMIFFTTEKIKQKKREDQ